MHYNKHVITSVLSDGKVNFIDAIKEFEYVVKISPRIEMTDEGYLICRDAILGNVGEIIYSERELGWSRENKAVRVRREAQDIFDENSLASLEGKPVTIHHPRGNVNSKNFKDLGHGTILGKPKREGDNIVADIIFHSEELVDMVTLEIEDEQGNVTRKLNEGFRDLSLGYKAKLVQIALDLYKQTDIIYNHLAVVPEGRQQNASIRDSKNEKEEEPKKMSLLDKLLRKGKKVTQDESGIHISNEDVFLLDEEVLETEEAKDEDAKEKAKEVKDEEVKEEKEKEKETVVKDKAYYIKALQDAHALPESSIKKVAIADLDKEFADAFPEEVKTTTAFSDATPVDSNKLNMLGKDANPNTPLKPRFEEVEALKATHYRNLTDPFAHGGSWKAFKDNYDKEVAKGRNKIA